MKSGGTSRKQSQGEGAWLCVGGTPRRSEWLGRRKRSETIGLSLSLHPLTWFSTHQSGTQSLWPELLTRKSWPAEAQAT